jgi:acyl-CoA oxidase
MGLISNHAVVYARMMIDGKDYGVHPFMVQLRDVETHTRLNGIESGDVGPKFGYNSKDNGWLIFTNVRIPRTNLVSNF